MFQFGKRSIIKQGGSYVVSLPMQWIRSLDVEVKTVTIEMDGKNRLRIVAGNSNKDSAGFGSIHEGDINR